MRKVPDVSPETCDTAFGPAHGRILGFANHATQTTFFALSIDFLCSVSIERKSIEAAKKVV
jgi:hypothetical protein